MTSSGSSTASTQPARRPSAFIDSSVLFAASLSSTGFARDLVAAAVHGRLDLWLSPFVLEETRRNRAAKAPGTLPFFHAFERTGVLKVAHPPAALVREVAQIVVLKDARIVPGAIAAEALFIASYDRKHLLRQAAAIRARYGITVDTPDTVLSLV